MQGAVGCQATQTTATKYRNNASLLTGFIDSLIARSAGSPRQSRPIVFCLENLTTDMDLRSYDVLLPCVTVLGKCRKMCAANVQ